MLSCGAWSTLPFITSRTQGPNNVELNSTTEHSKLGKKKIWAAYICLSVCLPACLSLSFCFNGHFPGFPGEPGLAGVYWSKGWWRWWWQLDYWSYKSCKAPVKSSPTNQHPVFLLVGCPSCRPSNNVKALKGKISHSMDLLTPSSSGDLPTLSLTTNCSWLPWGRVAMPLNSSLMPVPKSLSSSSSF